MGNIMKEETEFSGQSVMELSPRSYGAEWDGEAGISGFVRIHVVVPSPTSSTTPSLDDWAYIDLNTGDNADDAATTLANEWNNRKGNQSTAAADRSTVFFTHPLIQDPKNVVSTTVTATDKPETYLSSVAGDYENILMATDMLKVKEVRTN